MASFRTSKGEDWFLAAARRRREADLSHGGPAAEGLSDNFTVVDFYESKMSEYDANFVFVPIRELQELRGMIDPKTGIGHGQRDPDQAQAGRRRQQGPRQAAGAPSTRSVTRSRPGTTSKRPCWRPWRWRPPSSTCCCS